MWNLIPWPGIKPRLPALGVQRLSHWTLCLLFTLHILPFDSVDLLWIYFHLWCCTLGGLCHVFHSWPTLWMTSLVIFSTVDVPGLSLWNSSYRASWIDLIFLSTLFFLFVFCFFFPFQPFCCHLNFDHQVFYFHWLFSGSLNIPLQRANLSLFPGSCTFYLLSEDSIYT